MAGLNLSPGTSFSQALIKKGSLTLLWVFLGEFQAQRSRKALWGGKDVAPVLCLCQAADGHRAFQVLQSHNQHELLSALLGCCRVEKSHFLEPGVAVGASCPAPGQQWQQWFVMQSSSPASSLWMKRIHCSHQGHARGTSTWTIRNVHEAP